MTFSQFCSYIKSLVSKTGEQAKVTTAGGKYIAEFPNSEIKVTGNPVSKKVTVIQCWSGVTMQHALSL